MLENRITVVVLLGYILGIVMGLYCKISIVLFYVLLLIIYVVSKLKSNKDLKKVNKRLKLVSVKRYSRYLKIIFTKKVLIIIIFSSIISNCIILFQNFKYENLYKGLDEKEVICKGIVVSNVQEKEYKKTYKVKVISINGNIKDFKNTNLYVNIKTTLNKLENDKENSYGNLYGKEVIIKGKYIEPKKRRNYRGFDYKQYLKTLKTYGTVELEDIHIIKENAINPIFMYLNDLSSTIKSNIQKHFNSEEQAVVLGLILGDKSEISKNTIEDFSESNILHILAVSGMHLMYVILIFSFIFNSLFGRKYGNILTSFVILIYMFITGFSPSVVRAGITGCLVLLSENFKLRSDKWANIATSMLLILIYNPFLLISTSLLLSYAGTLGIILINNNLIEIVKSIEGNIEKKFLKRNFYWMQLIIRVKGNRFFLKLKESLILTISVYLILIPVMMTLFNKVAVFSLLISVIIAFFAVPAVIVGIIFVLIVFSQFNIIVYLISKFENFLVGIIIKLSKFGSNIFLNNLTVITPNLFEVFVYYIILFASIFLSKLYFKKNLNVSEIRIKNLISLLKYRVNQNKQKLNICIISFCLIFLIVKICPKSLKIYFIDVGQGDCTLIETPKNQKILIDGGGSSNKNFDVGKSTLVPYLLDRRINKLDYIFISHFDTDHIGGILTVMEEMKVGKVIISKQGEDSENYKKFKEIVMDKKIKVEVVGIDMSENLKKIEIEKYLYFDVLWPNTQNLISENVLNNNSIVCKLNYKNFSMLFTGDIEEIAEKNILQEYKNNLRVLNSTILKVAHHGSKTSSSEIFIKSVNPKIALIGVGENNNFGHPNEEVIKRLENIRKQNI